MNIAFWLLFLFASVLAYVMGRYDGKQQPGKTVYINEWPRLSVQWDSHLSQEQVIELIDKVRAHVLANPLAIQRQGAQQQGSSDDAMPPDRHPPTRNINHE